MRHQRRLIPKKNFWTQFVGWPSGHGATLPAKIKILVLTVHYVVAWKYLRETGRNLQCLICKRETLGI